MVDVSGKEHTERVATAKGSVFMRPETLARILEAALKKAMFSVAQLAGIMGAKRAPDLIPLCRPLALAKVSVALNADENRHAVDIEATCKLKGQTGVRWRR